MAVLTTAQRKRLKPKQFGLSKQRRFPVNDRAHAANAKARATQGVKKGTITPAQKATIDRKANKVLGTSKRTARKK